MFLTGLGGFVLLIKLLALIAIVPWCISPFFALLLQHFVPKFESVLQQTSEKWFTATQVSSFQLAMRLTTIERASNSACGTEYPNLEVVVVNDRSDDDTGAIIIVWLATEDHRIRTVHIDHLPEGWLGKVYALKWQPNKPVATFCCFPT